MKKCPVCKKRLNTKKQHKYAVVEIKYDGVLGVVKTHHENTLKISRRGMHTGCANTYKAAEKIMLSAGVLEKKLEFITIPRDRQMKVQFISPNDSRSLRGSNAKFFIDDGILF